MLRIKGYKGRGSSAHWATVQRLIESGAIGYGEAAKRMGVSVQAVRQRAYRGRWLSQDRIKRRAASLLCSVMPEEVLEDAADSWRERGDRHRLRLFDLAHEALQRADLPAPKTWRDAQVADNMARKAIGLDEASAKASHVINVQWMQETIGSVASRLDQDAGEGMMLK